MAYNGPLPQAVVAGGTGSKTVITIDLHVCASGNDTTGTGTLSLPYLTAAKAFSVAHAGTPSAAKNYNIYLHGVVTEAGGTAPQITQFTKLIGDGSLHDLNGNTMILLAADWVTAGAFFELRNIDHSGQTISLDGSAFTDITRDFKYYDWNLINTETGAAATVTINSYTSNSTSNAYTHKFYNCVGFDIISGILATLNFSGGYGYFYCGALPGIINVVPSPNLGGGTEIYCVGAQMPAQFTASSVGQSASNFLSVIGCDTNSTSGTISLTGGSSSSSEYILAQDGSGYPSFNITASGTVVIAGTDYAQYVNVQHTPINYTATAPPTDYVQALEQHIAGIDNALGGTSVGTDAGVIYNCIQSWTSTSTTTMNSGWVNIYDGSEWIRQTYASPIVMNIAANGANALDTGSVANNTWYYILAIYGSGKTPAWLFTATPASPTYPAGYTANRIVGGTKTAIAATDLIKYNFNGIGNDRRYQWTDATYIGDLRIVNSTAASGTGVSCAPGQLPEVSGIQSRVIQLYVYYAPAAPGDSLMIKDNADTTSLNFYGVAGQVTAVSIIDTSVEIINPSNQLRWASDTSGTTTSQIYIRGFSVSV